MRTVSSVAILLFYPLLEVITIEHNKKSMIFLNPLLVRFFHDEKMHLLSRSM